MYKLVQVFFYLSQVFPVLMQKLGFEEKETVLPWQQVEISMTTVVLSMAAHSTKEHMTPVWDMMLVNTVIL